MKFCRRPEYSRNAFMRARLSVALALLLLAAGYAAAPGFAVWNLMTAVRNGDVAVLQRGVDWNAVRAGLKQDVSEGVIAAFGGSPNTTQFASNVLPPFGASFVSSIAASAIDHEVTAENLAAMSRRIQTDESNEGLISRIAQFRFTGPTDFTFALRGDEQEDGVLKLHLTLRDGHWILVRAWIPQDMIDWVAQRT
jgi:hypothetical protein